MPENVSNELLGPTSINKPKKPTKTPINFVQENSPLYKLNNSNAVNIGTVAWRIDRDPAPS